MKYRIRFEELCVYETVIESDEPLPAMLEADELADDDWFPLVDQAEAWQTRCCIAVEEREVRSIMPADAEMTEPANAT